MNRKSRLLALGAGASVLAMATHLGLSAATRSAVEATLRDVPGASHGPLTVDTLSGRVTVADLAITGEHGSLAIASITLPTPYALISPALAAGDLSFEGVTGTFGETSISVPKVDISGTSNTREDIAQLVDPKNERPLAARLAAINAASVSMPSLTLDVKQNAATSHTVYKDVRISGINAGIIRSTAASSVVMDATDPKGAAIRSSSGPMSISDLDTPLFAQVYFGGGDPKGELRLAQGSFTLESIAVGIKSDGGNGAFTVGRLAMKGLRMRPSSQPLVPLMQDLAGKNGNDLSPEDTKRVLSSVTEYYQSFAVDSAEASDIAIEGPTGSGRGTIARVAFTGAQVGKPNELRIEAIDVKGPDGYGRIGTIAHSGWSYARTLKALREAAEQPGDLAKNLNPRDLVPDIGTIAIRDLEIDVPDVKARKTDPKAPNVHLGLKGFEFSASEPLAGVPTALRVSADRLTLPLPAGEKSEGLKDLVAMGYKELDVSSTLDARWSDASGELSLNQVSLQSVNMGQVSLRGTVGNVPKDVFTGDSTTAQIALLGATIKQASLTLENKGLFERVLETQAKAARKTPEQLRKEFAAAAQIGIPAMLGGSASAKQIAQAVAKFVAKPNRLTLSAKSRDPGGIGLADFGASGGDPRAILDALNVTATAE
jgi:hypothetical protein